MSAPGTLIESAQENLRQERAQRLLFVDNLRWSMIILVLSMHACDTYSPFGNWYYTDRPPLSHGERVFFATYQNFLQGFFMALLFFVAATFTPASYDRKGAKAYLRDRFVRLMVPTLIYIFGVGPLTEYYISRTWTGGGGFIHQWLEHATDGEWMSGTGPMWFCAVLFGFSAIYTGVRFAWDRLRIGRFTVPPRPSPKASLVVILVMAVATFVVRMVIRGDTSILNVHPGDLPQYAVMFTAGILAGRGKWLEHSSVPGASTVAIGALSAAAAIWVFVVAWATVFPNEAGQFNGGLNPLSAVKCLWEALVCVGMSYLLLGVYRRYFNDQGSVARLLSQNAFAVYLFHPPIIIAIAILLHGLTAPGPWKAALLTLLAAIASFSLSHLVFRRIPYLRQVL